jgi:succinoglycan biosynthesis transport protein ExoP
VTQRQLDKVPPASANCPFTVSAMMRYSHTVALSGFAETMRSAKVGIDIALGDKKPKIIGIISVLPHEGKSTTAKNLASMMAHLGARALLIDGDLRNPSLTRELSPEARGGLLEVLTEGAEYRSFVQTEPDTKLDILLAKVGRQLTHTSELIASRAMGRFLADAGQDYDYIIIDLPPLGPVVDVRAAAKHFDGFIVVAEWGKTPRDVVATTLLSDANVYDKCIGVILNKVDQKALALYQGYGAKEYYYGQYRAYYRERP